MIYVDNDTQEEIELATYNKKLYDLTEAVSKAEGWEKVKAQYDFVGAAFGATPEAREYLAQRLGGKTVDKCDLMVLSALFMEVQDAYKSVIQATETAMMADRFSQLGDLGEKIAPMLELINAFEAMDEKDKALAAKKASRGREAFKRIK